ncbi:hypothetical protein LUZ63_017400 [Rhynchospora breviuscula]|uniref:AB hydrolase-1 domain-containing protein n=1 Tax=Rhynchospora breviuscula TaxID=2022672 RepID=A0A9Q0HGY2_9POAL|nr:hypothetical protein LUZ63_017400 [Rhynchospora breviuscula]
MESISHKLIDVNGISMHVAEKGPEDGPAILFIHGFPELWYSWRHQILYLSVRGYRCIALDLRGYGGSTAPPSVSSYTIFHLVGDLIALLDSLSLPQVFVAGHNCGAIIAWNLCMFRPDRVKALVNLSVAFMPRNPAVKTVDYFRSLYGDNYYVCRFQKRILSILIASKFQKSGFTGGINYYRCMDINWELTAPWTGAQINVPTKYIVGDVDLTYHYPGIQDFIHKGGLKTHVPLLEEPVVIKGAGHFIQQERAQEISDHIYEFIKIF